MFIDWNGFSSERCGPCDFRLTRCQCTVSDTQMTIKAHRLIIFFLYLGMARKNSVNLVGLESNSSIYKRQYPVMHCTHAVLCCRSIHAASQYYQNWEVFFQFFVNSHEIKGFELLRSLTTKTFTIYIYNQISSLSLYTFF